MLSLQLSGGYDTDDYDEGEDVAWISSTCTTTFSSDAVDALVLSSPAAADDADRSHDNKKSHRQQTREKDRRRGMR